MKTKKFNTKLVLKKQTVSNMNSEELKVVGAGYPASGCRETSCPPSWDCPTDTCGCGSTETCVSCDPTCGGRICDWSYYPNNPC